MMRSFVLLVLLLLLPGCTAVKIAYNQADVAVAWMADDYFDLKGEQKNALRTYLERYHAWHRTTQLNEYARLLDAAQQRVNAGVTTADTDWVLDNYRTRYRALVVRGSADAARMLSTLSEEQIEAARKEFDASNRKFIKEHAVGAGAEEQRRSRAKRHLERLEHWTGPLSAAQVSSIEELCHALPLVADLRLQDRVRRQREFLALLEMRRDLELFSPRLREWLLDRDRARPPEHAAQLSASADALARLYLETFRLLTPDQRSNVAARMHRYAQSFRELAEEAPRTANLAARP